MPLRRGLTASLLLSLACGPREAEEPVNPPASEIADLAVPPGRPEREYAEEDIPASMRACWTCHLPIVESYLGHGMAASIGPVGEPPVGSVQNPQNGNRYDFSETGALDAYLGTGGRRRQQVVGRIGAGIFDTSWVTAEVDLVTGAQTGRLFFAPAETVAEVGLKLSPFENHAGSQGLDLALDYNCLTCHTRSDLAGLAGAATGPQGDIYPGNLLGATAFDELEALSCSSCHGDPSRHLEILAGTVDADGIGMERLGQLPAVRQRDICARCHLQGEARLELARELSPEVPLAAQWPSLVPTEPGNDYRFVSQLERLALSSCYEGSPDMTCTTCHEPHVGVARQGVASFEAACAECHHQHCSRPTELTVLEVTGRAARSEAGCVDCHVRRSQPFDLPLIRNADHWIRRRITPAEQMPHRQFTDAEGDIEIFDDGRLAAGFRTPEGRRWRDAVHAMGLMTLGRQDAARRAFEAFPAPGTPDAVSSSGPPGWASLESTGLFHELRAMSLQSQGDLRGALAAYSDALTVEPGRAGTRISRARLSLMVGDLATFIQDTQIVINEHPQVETPWDLRAAMALHGKRPDMAADALTRSTELWPSNPGAWLQLAQVLEVLGRSEEAGRALARARALAPDLAMAHSTAR
jgi:hypothetical protein